MFCISGSGSRDIQPDDREAASRASRRSIIRHFRPLPSLFAFIRRAAHLLYPGPSSGASRQPVPNLLEQAKAYAQLALLDDAMSDWKHARSTSWTMGAARLPLRLTPTRVLLALAALAGLVPRVEPPRRTVAARGAPPRAAALAGLSQPGALRERAGEWE